MNRRQLLTSVAAGAVTVLALHSRAGASATQWLLQMAAQNRIPTGTPYPLVELPRKAPLGQVYDIPPNYETPMHKLIGKQHYPRTDNEYYYVRYREPMPAQLDPAEYRLTITGDAMANPLELTMDDLKAFPAVTRTVVGECTGLGVGLLRPVVAAMPWTKGDVSCAEWTGASLKAVLEEAGISPDAQYVAFRSGALTIAGMPEEEGKRPYVREYRPESVLIDDAMLAYQWILLEATWRNQPTRLAHVGLSKPSRSRNAHCTRGRIESS